MKPEVDVVLRSMMTKLLLEVAHALTQARCRHSLLDGGTPEVAQARHRDERAEIAQIDILHCALQ